MILADISGSVSAFAAFTLQLAYALRSEFSRVRSFVFVDGINEVTDIMQSADNIVDVTRQINAEALGVWLDGRSDYGHALDTFWELHGLELKSRTTVLVLGDARTNYHSSRAAIITQMWHHAGHVFWLNPRSQNPSGTAATPSSRITPSTATAYTSAATCDSFASSSNVSADSRCQ